MAREGAEFASSQPCFHPSCSVGCCTRWSGRHASPACTVGQLGHGRRRCAFASTILQACRCRHPKRDILPRRGTMRRELYALRFMIGSHRWWSPIYLPKDGLHPCDDSCGVNYLCAHARHWWSSSFIVADWQAARLTTSPVGASRPYCTRLVFSLPPLSTMCCTTGWSATTESYPECLGGTPGDAVGSSTSGGLALRSLVEAC